MARLVMCGWESGSVLECPTNIAGGTISISATARTGDYSFSGFCNTYTTAASQWSLPGNPAEIYFRAGLRVSAMGGTGSINSAIIQFRDGGTTQIAFRVGEGAASSAIYRGGTSLGSFAGLGVGGWVCVEIYVKIHASAGRVTVWFNGAQVFDFTGDTLESSTEQITHVIVGANFGGGTSVSQTLLVDDLAVNDTTGSSNNGRVGQGGIIALRPTADTADKDFSRSTGSDNYALVDETQANDETDYVYSGTATDRDLYELANLSGVSGTISAISVVGHMRSEGGAGAQAALTLKSNTTVQEGATKALTEEYASYADIYETDPATGVAWTVSGVNALLAGVTVK